MESYRSAERRWSSRRDAGKRRGTVRAGVGVLTVVFVTLERTTGITGSI